jgi:hypothetical protein
MSTLTRLATIVLLAGTAWGGEWTDPVEVRHDDKLCVSYRARWNGDMVAVQVTIEPGWHTFVMDNKQRQQEKLAGKPSLGIEKSTEIKVTDGLEVAGPWFQTAPTDFSKPEIRWYTWGFEQKAMFGAKARRSGGGPAHVGIKGQACTADICKNIDVSIALPLPDAKAPATSDIDLAALTQVR